MSNYMKPRVRKKFGENEHNDENALIDENRKNISRRNREPTNIYYTKKKLNEKLKGKSKVITDSGAKKQLSSKEGTTIKHISGPATQKEEHERAENENDGNSGTMNDSAQADGATNEGDQIEQRKKEIKELANLCLEKNLSVNSENIQIVRKLKEKRMLEEQINKNENIKNLQEKRRILEQIEYHEWADREKRIKELQEKKMKLLKKVIIQRDTEKADRIFYEVEKIVQNRDKNKDKIIENFEKEKARDMRNLFVETKNNLKTIFNEKTDIVHHMNDHTSNYNLQLERNGTVPEKINEKTSNKIDNLLNLHDLNDLNMDFDKSSKYTQGEKKYDKFSKYEEKKNKQIIDTFYRYLNKEESKYTSEEYVLGESIKTQKKGQCMKINFPSIEVKSSKQDIFEKNILQLQNLLRGKAIKMLMNDGKQSYSDLIEELKAYEKIDQISANEKDLFEKENFEEIKLDSYLENVQGKYISELLDSLSNELEKYEEERKIAVLVKYAERERRLKECKEKGKRQAEFLLREKEDYIFNEIMGLNNQTVDSYLEDILSKAINDASKEEALIRTKKKAEQLNEIYNSLDNNSDENNKLIVKDLVGNFIIPYVDKQRGLQFDLLEQKKNNCVSNFATQHVFSKINEAF
ncbi:hypothetical protein, conserved in Apicomplexan species [Plasmodium knowlesi strain H]|uniref:Cilia- and flagella-associated protein 91 n=3 Tax=Plasmodium knowlesi TaxID=5850 RepID=A0A5K1VH48_PLAKH|nr:uncharacterized protein PKNH_1423000 [Plasmodium knowlesi strain H]OTN64229.1 Uncharacterized protein PKNOH_S140240800 [Plasmodium knowlesi]CAA9990830.1 MAATS1 domain-containing protein, putative [Plasmodium knowlesi strain H]SBO20984.1 hypothetical protein, conserved in Apicomplexan species [Plasmodium knowlesi strain H]SBO21478.1 hypothetical protein, conserved in Apicomplexan species [Plasmodium knowlesi strain H]VVS80304.1 MAATS1 domain-containing protein, putative [Plasmodium knowlesi |eukprot:XP_002262118.1 [Plasmodium knowlesi strain H]